MPWQSSLPPMLRFAPHGLLMFGRVAVWTVCLSAAYVPNLFAEEPALDYLRHIKPVLEARCYACHGVLMQEASLRLDTAALARQGGDSGAALVANQPDQSLLLARVSALDEAERMPPEGEPLSAEQIAQLRAWISAGAPAPADEQPEPDPRDHWAFQPPVRPAVPAVADRAWSLNPIDAFLAAEHQRRNLQPQTEADRRILLRRVYLDLIGLPPTPEELDAFVADTSPTAYESRVDRLLQSPLYGQRWGRHWMDIWRYSDPWGLGNAVRNSHKHLWHWRDWIIEALNDDKGYDQMLREMLAADELYPDDLDRLRATGFLARHYFLFNRTTWLDGTIEHTSKALLGLTFNCGKCHDHKYDPISQTDYYRLRAVFEPYQLRTEALPGQADLEAGGVPRAFDCNLDTPTYLHLRGDDRNPDTSRAIEPAVPAFLSQAPFEIEPVELPPVAYEPALRPYVLDNSLQAAHRKVDAARQAVAQARDKLADAQGDAELHQLELRVAEHALATAEAQPAAIEARASATTAPHRQLDAKQVKRLADKAARAERAAALLEADEELVRCQLAVAKADDKARPEAEKQLAAAKEKRQALEAKPLGPFTPLAGALKTAESNIEPDASRFRPFPRVSTGRRAALARWITDRRHPLTARVAVNHIWLRHMGRPLVPTVFDFGRKGAPPTHPELLDWLAIELMDHDWSMKHLHRLIVTSRAYQLSSSNAGADPGTRDADPENHFYWRANSVRMEAQIVRDSLLHLADELDLAFGGPPVPLTAKDARRRSLYFFHSHKERHPLLTTFDDANVEDCYQRAESIVPQQALALENSELAVQMAGKIAQRLASLDDAAFVRTAFVTVLAVEPSAAERTAVEQGLARLTAAAAAHGHAHPAAQARTLVVQTLLNHNDFITIR